MKISSKLLMGIAAMALSLHAQASPGESVVFDPVTGNYTITYRGDQGSYELSQTIFVPATKIVPVIRSSFRLGDQGIIVYRYTVFNGATAKQAIVGVVLDQIVNPVVGELPFPRSSYDKAENDAYDAALKAAIATPAGWHGNITRFRIDTHGEILDRIYWMPNSDNLNTNGIQAGRTLSGFGFSSMDLPGIGPSQLDGLGEILGFPDEGPIEDSAVFAEVDRLQRNDFIVRNAAVPTISVPSPFDPAVTLDRIQAHTHTWIAKQLLAPAFSAQLDRYFQSAISAYRLNQPKVGKKHIQTMRELIHREYPDMGRDGEHESEKSQGKDDGKKSAMIDRLAARILDFDLKYVIKSMGGDKDD